MEDQLESNNSLKKYLAGVKFHPGDYEEVSLPNLTTGQFDISFPHAKEIQPSDIEHVKTVLITMNKKFSTNGSATEELQLLRDQLGTTQKNRRDLEASISETALQFDKEIKKQSEFFESALNERTQALKEIVQLKATISEQKLSEEKLRTEMEELKHQLCEIDVLKRIIADKDLEIKQLNERIQSDQQSREAMQKTFSTQLETSEKKYMDLNQSCQALAGSKLPLQDQIKQLTSTVSSLTRENEGLRLEIEAAKSAKALEDARAMLQTSQMYEQLNKDNLAARAILQNELKDTNNSFAEEYAKIREANEVLTADKADLKSQLLDLMNDIYCLQDQLADTKADNFDLSSKLAKVEQVLCVKFDELDFYAEKLDDLEFDVNMRGKMSSELDSLSNYLIQISQSQQDAQSTIAMLTEKLQQKAMENQLLTQLLRSTKQAYTPAQEPIDQALAEFFKENHMEILVTREGPGQYLLGSKPVEMALENGTLFVTYNKHTMTLEKFVKMYGEEESNLLGNDAEDEMASIARREKIANRIFHRLLNEKIVTPEHASRVVLENTNLKYSMCKDALANAGSAPNTDRDHPSAK